MCNKVNRSLNLIPIYSYAFCSYKSKLLLNVINKTTKVRTPLKFLLLNLQKLRFLTYNSFKFQDSLEHLPSSLCKLVTELNNPYQNHDFPIVHQSKIVRSFLQKFNQKKVSKIKLKLSTNEKGKYPYLLCNDAHIMKKIFKFSPIEKFFNNLTNTSCPTED